MSDSKVRFLDRLEQGVLLADGGMGTELYSRGVFINRCFDELNVSQPDLVMEVHRDYLKAGADVILTNTFGANRYKLAPHGLGDRVEELNRKGAEIARQAAAGRDTFVAGSIGPLGLKIEPWGPTSVEEAQEAFFEQARALLQGGVDLFYLETFLDLNEIHQAIRAIHGLCDLPLVASMTLEDDGNSLYGTAPEMFTKRLEDWGADVVGVNCSVGPQVMLEAVEKMAAIGRSPIAVKPNAGKPRSVDGRNIYLCSPEYMAEYAKRFIQNGAKIVGGCCGTNPEHIRAMRSAVHALQPRRVAAAPVSIDESDARVVEVPTAEKSALGRKIAARDFVVMVEIVPPRGTNAERSLKSAAFMKEHGIDAVNIPDGPRASARMSPMALAVLIQRDVGIEVLLHYCCRDRNLLGMQSDFLGAQALGVRNMLLITGDPPKLGDYPDATAVFDVDSIGLTNMVRRLNRGMDLGGNRMGQPTSFLIGVGVNPGAINEKQEIHRFEWKVDAGAEFAITQPVFDVEVLKKFLARISHCRIPVMAGLWPLASVRNAEFMNNEVPGAHVPDAIMERMRRCGNGEVGRMEGIAIAREVIAEVRDLVQGIQISVPFGRWDTVVDLIEGLR